MANYYERYQQGFYQEVYDELLEAGENVFIDVAYADVQLVAKTLMQRVRYNIDLIVSRLRVLNYRFGDGMFGLEDEMTLEEKLMIEKDMPIFRSPTAEVSIYLRKLEQLIGTLPLSLIYWYKEVGCVNLVGLFTLQEKREFHRQDGSDLDPLLIYPVELVFKIVLDYHERNVWEKDPTFPLSPDNLLKYGYSGSGTYTIKAPQKVFDAPLLGEKHHTTFINYLRIAIRWGGFPGLEWDSKLSKEDIHFLTRDLIPF